MMALHGVTVALPAGAPNPKTVLDSITLSIGRGEWIALVGPNGSGKTTLLHTIAGLHRPASGRVEYSSPGPARRPAISLLLQEPDNQFVTTSVRHELQLSTPPGMEDGEAGRRMGEAVERFSLGTFVDRDPRRLSGGEKQRLALATVWLQEPELLLLDEPTSYLDGEAAAMCMDFVEEARGRGVSVVWATPGGEELERADRVVCLAGGRARYEGCLEDLYDWAVVEDIEFVRPPVREIAERIAEAVAPPEVRREILEPAGSDLTVLAEEMAPLVSGVRGVDEPVIEDEPAAADEEVVHLSSVGFGYDDVPALEGIDLAVNRGECVGLAGPNGAGKSTLLGLIAAVIEPTSGEIARENARAARKGRRNVFYLFQSPERLFFAETVAEELLFGARRLGLSTAERDRRVTRALGVVGLDPDAYLLREPLTLSLGEMRRVAFAIALSLEPDLLLLDEPTSCLDPGGCSVLESILADHRKGGKASVVASHDAGFLAGVCDRIVWLRGGRIEKVLETGGGRLPAEASWPGGPLPVLELQDCLTALGVDVVPRELTVHGLVERFLRE
jgi:energy-coupling factor transport system ATP-binding protein